MRVFVTGASGWIGSAVIPELLAAGHQVVGLARSDEAAARVAALGAEVRRGDLDDTDRLAEAAAAVRRRRPPRLPPRLLADGARRPTRPGRHRRVRRRARGHRQAASVRVRHARAAPGRSAPRTTSPTRRRHPRVGNGARRAGARRARRPARRGAVRARPCTARATTASSPTLVARRPRARRRRRTSATARTAGRRSTVSTPATWSGSRWTTHRPARRVHAVAEEGMRDPGHRRGHRPRPRPAGRVDRRPRRRPTHFGWIGDVLRRATPRASSAKTRELLGWEPTGPTLLEDLDAGYYTA